MAKKTLPFEHASDDLAPAIERGFLTGALIGAVRNIRTMNDLLVTEYRHGDGFTPDMCEGVYDLILHQTRILAAVTNQVSEWEEEHRAQMLAEAAERDGVAEGVRKVREAFIVASAEAGAAPEVIAQALHMRRASIERVIGQLRGGAAVAPEAARAASA